MNQKLYTEVALNILGLYAFIRGLNGIFNYCSAKIFFSWSYLPLFIPSIIFWIMAGLLFRYAPIIASYLYNSDETSESTETIQIHEWYRLAFSIIGIVLLFWMVLPGLVHGVNSLLFPLDLKDSVNDRFSFSFLKSQKISMSGRSLHLWGT